jgi:hypothetical protein
VETVEESCVDHAGGNREAFFPQGDTIHKSIQNNRRFVLHCFLQRLRIVNAFVERY